MSATKQRRNIASEHNEQATLIRWIDLQKNVYPELQNLFAIPNGGQRNIIVAAKLKAEGVKAGVPDLFLPIVRNGRPGLFVEMKRTIGGRTSESQSDWHQRLKMQGYCVAVCAGWEEAKKTLIEYITTTPES